MWDFSDIQDAPIKESVFDLPQETLDRYADASPSEVRDTTTKMVDRFPMCNAHQNWRILG